MGLYCGGYKALTLSLQWLAFVVSGMVLLMFVFRNSIWFHCSTNPNSLSDHKNINYICSHTLNMQEYSCPKKVLFLSLWIRPYSIPKLTYEVRIVQAFIKALFSPCLLWMWGLITPRFSLCRKQSFLKWTQDPPMACEASFLNADKGYCSCWLKSCKYLWNKSHDSVMLNHTLLGSGPSGTSFYRAPTSPICQWQVHQFVLSSKIKMKVRVSNSHQNCLYLDKWIFY